MTKLYKAGVVSLLAFLLIDRAWAGDTADIRYGFLGGLDHRSWYGQGWFPEPFRLDESDLDNELRVDWFHQEGKGQVSDSVKTEVEKSFGLLTIEVEGHYEHTSTLINSPNGDSDHDRLEGIGNIDLGGRLPVFQWVSADENIDNSFGVALEVGAPTNSPVSKTTEIVPKIFDDLRIGSHFSIQTVIGDSILLGSRPEGGSRTFEYGVVFGYLFEHDQIPIPRMTRTIPVLELKGETGLTRDNTGQNNLSGTAGLRFNMDSIGVFQPRLGIGYVFPINNRARADFDWGVVTSVVFEF